MTAREGAAEGGTNPDAHALVTLCREIAPCDPLAFFAQSGAERFYWERVHDELAIATEGCVAAIEARGARRFAEVEASIGAALSRCHAFGDAAPLPPFFAGGFAFDDVPADDPVWHGLPAARWVLPRRAVVRSGARCFATWTRRVEAGETRTQARALLEAQAREPSVVAFEPPAAESDPPCYTARSDDTSGAYCRRVAGALAAIGRGDVEKLVVARRVCVEASEAFRPASLLATLRGAHPSCTSFAVGAGGAVLLGATPERLLRVRGDRLETAALAGSAPRGRSPEEDARLARELVESKKEQAEHAVVVREMRRALEAHCRTLAVPEAPRLLRLDGIQHLETPIEAQLRSGSGLFLVARDLHPTPAVGGAPRDAALSWLDENEELARGWYGGAVGFSDGAAGDLAVVLRSALVRERTAFCFAGAGVVSGSLPEAELRETRLKLAALLAPLMEI